MQRHLNKPLSTVAPPSVDPPLAAGRAYRRRQLASGDVARAWRIAVLVSVVVHLVLVVLLLVLVRSKPTDRERFPPGTVELLMVERRGSRQSVAATPPQPKSTDEHPVAPTPTAPNQATAIAPPRPPPPDAVGEPVPPAAEPHPAAPQVAENPATKPSTPPPRPDAPEFNLEGTDSDSNADAMGERIIPASPDDRFRNRPPIYPDEALVRHETGAVVLLIHVSEFGVSTGADVQATSGVVSLDHAALDAVRKWHFHPAMKDGHAVPFDMQMRFIFSNE